MGMAGADMKLSENRYAHALRSQAARKAEFPDLSAEALPPPIPAAARA